MRETQKKQWAKKKYKSEVKLSKENKETQQWESVRLNLF